MQPEALKQMHDSRSISRNRPHPYVTSKVRCTMRKKQFTVHDRLGPVKFVGQRLAYCKWGGGEDKLRWTDMALYKITTEESEYRYVLEIIAKSYLYHRMDGPCVRSRHRTSRVADIRANGHRWENLRPCPRCAPGELEDMQDSDTVSEETDDRTILPCTSPSDIIKKLYQRNGEISEVAAECLQQAAKEDPEIATAWITVRRF